jgi:hypothetical protein
VALAAAFFGLDKFFNYSTGWMRYVKTDLALRTALEDFELEWEIARAGWPAGDPSDEQVKEMLGRCKAFAASINAIVIDETNVWITEFQASLNQLGDSVKAAEARVAADAAKREEAAKAVGALNVTVKHNGVTYGGKFKLKVNNEQNEKIYVGTAAIVGLPAGPNKLEARVEEGDKVHRGEISFDVQAGKTSPLELSVGPVA